MAKEKKDPIRDAVEEKVRNAKGILDERGKIRVAIERTKSQIAADKADVEAARKIVAAEEADVALRAADEALGKQPVRTEGRARPRLDELRRNQERSEILATGIQARLVQTDEPLLRAEEELGIARAAWKSELVEQFSVEFEKAAGIFQKTLLKGAALAAAIGASAIGNALEQIEVRSFDGKRRLIDLRPVKLNKGQWPTYPAWRNDSAAVAVHDAYAEPLALATAIAKESAPLHARLNAERAVEADRARKAEEQAEREARRKRDEQERLAALEKEKAAKAAAEAAPWYGVGIRVRSPGQLVG